MNNHITDAGKMPWDSKPAPRSSGGAAVEGKLMEPDQIDMMNENELREELRKLIARPSSCTAEFIVRNLWNHFADGYNQWDSLGQDEKDELFRIAVANEAEDEQ